MDIFINGKQADIVLDTEKTVGDILSGLELWLEGSGNRLSGLSIDGVTIRIGALGEAFTREISEIKNLDILVSVWPSLAAEALVELRDVCAVYADASFEERGELLAKWEESPAAAFLGDEIPDIALFARRSFSGEGLSPRDLGILAEERFREMKDPRGEILSLEESVSGITARMEELPLDIQTSRDSRAAETMQLFSRTVEKLFRLLSILKRSGLSLENFTVDSLPIKTFNDEFGAALKELCSAYNSRDTVLVGDLAEYELAPRFLKLYEALNQETAVFFR
jgi:hypothetical protein